ncbi:MAG: XdhC family protein [Pseudomonadota bacterium]
MKPDTLKAINEARRMRKACVVVKNFENATEQFVLEGEQGRDELGLAIAKVFHSGKSTPLELEGYSHFLNVYVPAPRLVIIGAVHISQALVSMAQTAGYDVCVIDPRSAFATPERFADVALYAEWPEDLFPTQPLDPYCAVAAVTHDPKIDDFPLIEALKTGCFYVGALGSRKTHGKRLERLKSAGLSEEVISQIHAPIGLDIGASTPQEIAVAILAQVIGAFRKRSLGDV